MFRQDSVPETAVAITPNDSTDLDLVGIYVGGTGAVSVVTYGSATPVTLAAVPVGTFIPLRIKRVRSTSTTATNIVGFKRYT